VIINGTKYYQKGVGWVESSELLILQMIGRAGRPQFTDKDKDKVLAIIMTSLGTTSIA
jgi:replicative superfamily II helicase